MSAALTLGFAIPFALVLLVLLVVVVLVDRNDEADPQGRRPYAAYVFVILFLTLFTALFAVTATTNSLMHIVVDDGSSSEARQAVPTPIQGFSSSQSGDQGFVSIGPSGPVSSSGTFRVDRGSDDARWRDVVRAGLLAAIAIVVLVFHAGMARRAADEAGAAVGRARRIYYAYLYATMALAVIVIIGAATSFGYAVFKVLAPGVASTSGIGKRKNALPDLVTTAVLLAGAGLIFSYHFRRRPTDGGQAVAALPPPPPPAPEPEPAAFAPPPRRPAKRATAAKKSAPRRSSRTE